MTTPDMNVALNLSLKDKLIAPLQRVVSQASSQMRELASNSDKTARSTASVADNLAKVGKNASGARQAAREVRNLGDETARTHREMSKLQQLSGKLGGLLRGGAAAYAGSLAFGHVVADPLRKAADYDIQLRRLANTAYSGKSLEERRAGIATIHGSVVNAVRIGGGSREDAMGALNTLVGSGAYSDLAEALAVLPKVMSTATASGGNASSLASIAIKARQSMGIKDPAQLDELFDRALAAGEAGGFELRDMERSLPEQMALARKAGLKGISGLTTLLAANQASLITAGSPDKAGNNMVNLLGKITSPDTAADFSKIGIDLTGSLAKANAKGINSFDAFIGIVDEVVKKDPRYVAAQKAALSATGSDRATALEAQADLLQGTAVGKVMQDRESLMGLMAQMNNRAYVGEVINKMNASKGRVQAAGELITESAGYKFDQRRFEAETKQIEAMTDANSAVAKLAEAQIDLYQRYPEFAKALEGTKVAVEALGVAALAAGGMSLLTKAVPMAGSFAVGSTLSSGSMLGIGGATLASMGVIATLAATNTVENNLETFNEVADNSMLSAMSGDAGFAAAIMSAVERPVQVNVHLDGRQIEATVTARQDQKGKRQ